MKHATLRRAIRLTNSRDEWLVSPLVYQDKAKWNLPSKEEAHGFVVEQQVCNT